MRVELRRALEEARWVEGSVFEGHYLEQRLVGRRHRALVLLGPHETELAARLQAAAGALHRAAPELAAAYWAPERALVAELGALPLGCHWFRMRALELADDAAVFRLESLRHLPERAPPPTDHPAADPADYLHQLSQDGKAAFQNVDLFSVIHVFKFLFIIMLSLITGLLKAIQFLGEFTLKFIHESANLIDKTTPIMFGCLNFMSKLASAFFISVTMLFRGNRPIRVQNYEAIDDGRFRYGRRSNKPNFN